MLQIDRPAALPDILTHRYSLAPLLLLTVALIYLPSINGAFYYDDNLPLAKLANVTDSYSALIYVFSDPSGPLGRSVSMITFLFNANDWPDNSQAFFLFNIVLHALNGILVFGLTYTIANLYQGRQASNYWLALGTSGFWLILPIHVSTSLVAIQRMAGLSAFFVFSGLLVYVHGLSKQNLATSNPDSIDNKQGLYWQLTGLVLFTLLAVFSKENGVLLPIFAFVLEITLLSKVADIEYRRKLRVVACGAGLVCILLYLTYYVIKTGNYLVSREFTLIERAQTQPQILLDYLRLAFIPQVSAFNPFHDNYQVVTSVWESGKSLSAIVVVFISLITAILYRRRFPLYAFAVLWFLGAHLLESSVIPLELFFEHRNYVAMLGPCLALVFSLQYIPTGFKTYAIGAALVYGSMLAVALGFTTQLWGNPQRAAETWHLQQPGSARATEHLGFRYLNQGEYAAAWEILEQQVKLCPTCLGSQAQAMFFSCLSGKQSATKAHFSALLGQASAMKQPSSVASALGQTYKLVQNNKCGSLTIADLKHLNQTLLHESRYSAFKKLQFIQNLYLIALAESNRAEAIRLLNMAWEEDNDINIANELVSILVANSQHSDAVKFVSSQVCDIGAVDLLLVKRAIENCNRLKKVINANK